MRRNIPNGHIFSFILLLGLSFAGGFNGCSSLQVKEGLQKVHNGMDKSEVLEVAGNPHHTYRSLNKDHWVYRYFDGDHQYSRRLTFENGHVIAVYGPMLRSSRNVNSDEEEDQAFEEYEKKIHEDQKENQGEFKDIPEK